MKQTILVVLGTPHSGISLFEQILMISGVKSINRHTDFNTNQIHLHLFKHLNHSPDLVGPLPKDWLLTPSADQAKRQMCSLLKSCKSIDRLFTICDPLACRFLPLWSTVFELCDYCPKFVFITRHPWESASSSKSKDGLDLERAHLLWLANTLGVISTLNTLKPSLVTYDQLLADPVTTLARIGTELNLAFPENAIQVTPELLALVQPELKTCHVANRFQHDADEFKAYELLYDNLRYKQWTADNDSALKVHQASDSLSLNTGLVERLFHFIGQQERNTGCLQIMAQQLDKITDALSVEFSIYYSDTTKGMTETYPITPDSWVHITLPLVPEDNHWEKFIKLRISAKSLIIQLSSIQVKNSASGQVLWRTDSSDGFAQLKIDNKDAGMISSDMMTIISSDPFVDILFPHRVEAVTHPYEVDFFIRFSNNIKFIQDYYATKAKEMHTMQNDFHSAIEKEATRINRLIRQEKSDRILSFAYRDSTGKPPDRYALLVTLHRCGSTWLMDALRTHPDIYIEPRAYLHTILGLKKSNRYPRDLTDDNATEALDIELAPGIGAKIPRIGSKQKPGLVKEQISINAYAVEKVHSEFFDFDNKRFTSDLIKAEQTKKTTFKLIYLVRDPKSVLSSFIKYKRRNTDWYKVLSENDLPGHVLKEYQSLQDLMRLKGGFIADYGDLCNNFASLLTSIYTFLWPDQNEEALQTVADEAQIMTDRESRIKRLPTPFFGNSAGSIKDGDNDLKHFFDSHESIINECHSIYQNLLSQKTDIKKKLTSSKMLW